MIRWVWVVPVLVVLAVIANMFTETPRRMAAIKRVLERNGSLGEVEKLVHLPSQVFYSDHVLETSRIGSVRYWRPEPGQEVRWYPKETLPCYFDLWLLVETSSRKVLDWRLFRLDQTPAK